MSELIKHTPGPWMLHPDTYHFTCDNEIAVVMGGRVPSYTTGPHRNSSSLDPLMVCSANPVRVGECAANANLIAAAPEMLAVCEAALDVIPRYEPKPERLEIWHQLKAVIAKAKGGVE